MITSEFFYELLVKFLSLEVEWAKALRGFEAFVTGETFALDTCFSEREF